LEGDRRRRSSEGRESLMEAMPEEADEEKESFTMSSASKF